MCQYVDTFTGITDSLLKLKRLCGYEDNMLNGYKTTRVDIWQVQISVNMNDTEWIL